MTIKQKIAVAHAQGATCFKIEDSSHAANQLSEWRKETKNPVISGAYGKKRLVCFMDNIWKRRNR